MSTRVTEPHRSLKMNLACSLSACMVQKNYPTKKEQSDLDIGLPDKTEDEFYLKTLRETLPYLIDQFEPDFVFYLSGVDVIETDKLGRLSLTIKGL